MLASRSLPEGYVLSGTIRLRGNRKLLLGLLLLSVPWAVVSAAGIGWLAWLVRPSGRAVQDAGVSFPVLGVLAVIVVAIVLHEAVHGVLMWMFTRSRPVFGFKGWYVYADSPGWFFQRWPMVAVGAGPLVVLPAIGLPLIALTPPVISFLILMGLIINSVAAIGDVYILSVLLRVRGPIYVGDAPGAKPGEAASWFLPATP
jgi:hypothetical protein